MVAACLRSGFVSTAGPLVAEFENRFADYVGVKYAIATASGTAALHVTLSALNISRGDSVIVPDLTFVASMNPALYCGASAILMDIDRNSWCLDPLIFEEVCKRLDKAGKKPSVIIPVHLYGCACDMDAIISIAGRFGIKVVEDATEALGTKIQNRQAGTLGDAGCFSFNGNKMITTGAGGMVVTNSSRMAKKVRHLVNQARSFQNTYTHTQMGFNYRLSNLSASLGLAQLEKLEWIIEQKKCIAQRYFDAFKDIPSIQMNPASRANTTVHWLFSVTVKNNTTRNRLLKEFAKQQISARKFFEPLHSQPYIQSRLWTRQEHTAKYRPSGNSNIVSSRGINLPSSPSMSIEDQQRVIQCFLRNVRPQT